MQLPGPKAVAELSQEEAQTEIKRLTRLILRLNSAYYEKDRPLVSDWRYDMLFRRLILIEKRFRKLADKKNSPTQKVGGRLKEGFASYRHKKPLLSLENAMDETETEAFIERTCKFLRSRESVCFAEPKVDGLSVNLCYENGLLTHGATRGNGELGEDVTANLASNRDIPLAVKNAPPLMEVRGEVYMSSADFAALNAKNRRLGLPEFANARNAAAGSIRQLDASVAAARNLRFFPYRLEVIKGESPKTQGEALELLGGWGFVLQPMGAVVKTAAERNAFFTEAEAKRDRLGYAVDGVVYKLNELRLQERLGNVSRHPRWAIARKFAADEAATVVKSITVQVGRRGTLTPVAELEPVAVGGIIVKRSTLHNADEIARLGLAAGDRVLIKRAGDVIPKVVRVLKKGKNRKRFAPPKNCPSCGGKVLRRQGEAAHFCPNYRGCRARIIGGLKHAASRAALDIEGLGEEHLTRLVDKGLVKNAVDLFRLGKHRRTLLSWQGWGEKMVANILEELAEKKKVSFGNLLVAFAPAQVGERTAAQIAIGYRNFGELLNGADELAAIDGIGEKTAKEITDWLQIAKKDGLLDAIEQTFSLAKETMPDGALRGEVIVFTGSLEKMTRSEAKSRAERLGAQVVGSVSAKTTMVVAGPGAGKKLAAAERKNLKILEEDQWLNLVAPQ